MSTPSPTIVRDLDFFLEPIFILVEDVIFQIPIHYVSQISIFSTAFTLPPNKDGIEGLTEEKPLILHQISKVDFKSFLRVLVPLQPGLNYSNISEEMWISTLKLSTMWEFTTLRDLAIRNLNQLDMIDMILLGSKYRVSQWFVTGCTKLIMRSCGPTEEEGNLLGMGFVVQIYGLRERMLSIRIIKGSGASFDCQRVVRETFPDKIFD